MSTPEFEAFLARIYTEVEARRRFLADPEAECRLAGLTVEQTAALCAIDRKGLKLAAESFRIKRMRKGGH